jgi:hypothetical protein
MCHAVVVPRVLLIIIVGLLPSPCMLLVDLRGFWLSPHLLLSLVWLRCRDGGNHLSEAMPIYEGRVIVRKVFATSFAARSREGTLGIVEYFNSLAKFSILYSDFHGFYSNEQPLSL